MKKPSLFTAKDFLVTIPALIATSFATYVQFFSHQNIQVYALMWTMSAMFWFCYVMLLQIRQQWLTRISFVTKHGLCVIMKDGFSFTQEQLEENTEEIIASWQSVLDDKSANFNVRTRAFGDYTFVTFKQGPLEHPQNRMISLAGYSIGRNCVVGVLKKDTKLHSTAFGHELGHVIYGEWKNDFNTNDAEHAFINANKLV